MAQNVRHLEILDERSTESRILPKFPGSTLLGGIGIRDTDLESTDDELGLHCKQERFLVAALTKMTMLRTFKWSCCHSPISIDNIWPTLLARCRSVQDIDIKDNMMFCNFDGQDSAPALVCAPLRLFECGTETNAIVARFEVSSLEVYPPRIWLHEDAKPESNMQYA